MSAPDTNLEKQKNRHRPALIGIAVVLVFAGLVFLMNMGTAIEGEGPLTDGIDDGAADIIDSSN